MSDIDPLLQSGAASAYGRIIRRTESPREIEYRVFAERTAALEAANRPDAPFVERIPALQDNRGFWDSLAIDLASEGNALPDALRAHLLGLAIWVHRETGRILRQPAASLDDLIEINRIVMQGLRPPAEGAPSPA